MVERSCRRPARLKHRVIEARSLAMDCLIARKIAADPAAVIEVAGRNLAAWRSRCGESPPRALDEWAEILKRPWTDIIAIMTDPGESAARLRQSCPFAGALTPVERKRIYDAFRA